MTAPAGLKTGPLSVNINGQKISGPAFTVAPFPEISTVTPLSGPAGQVMTIEGVNFSIIADENVVTINGKPVPVFAATPNTLTLTIPGNTGDGAVKLAVNDQAVTGPVFKDQTLGITKMTPDNGLAGTAVTITAHRFQRAAGGKHRAVQRPGSGSNRGECRRNRADGDSARRFNHR